jgi:hypothetical protein
MLDKKKIIKIKLDFLPKLTNFYFYFFFSLLLLLHSRISMILSLSIKNSLLFNQDHSDSIFIKILKNLLSNNYWLILLLKESLLKDFNKNFPLRKKIKNKNLEKKINIYFNF